MMDTIKPYKYSPLPRFLATAVWDNSWRLWDLEQLTEVLHQEGHSKEVYCVAFQQDGALAVSGGVSSYLFSYYCGP